MAPLPKLILASTSPYRRALLERLGLPFSSVAPEVDETRGPGESPERLVMRLAEAKARAGGAGRGPALVIGSDQVAAVDGEVLGKPGDHGRAVEQLRRCSGRTVRFYTGLCLLNTASDRARVDQVPCSVVFRALSPAQIERYLRHERPYSSAGSFKSEGLGIALFARMQGEDPNALVGLPLIRLVSMLADEGVDVLLAAEHTLTP